MLYDPICILIWAPQIISWPLGVFCHSLIPGSASLCRKQTQKETVVNFCQAQGAKCLDCRGIPNQVWTTLSCSNSISTLTSMSPNWEHKVREEENSWPWSTTCHTHSWQSACDRPGGKKPQIKVWVLIFTWDWAF